jgi:N-acetylglucosaminyl-diphospho-decaprenol L-rhamnosyltransferase
VTAYPGAAPTRDEQATVAAVVVTYDSGESLTEFLDSLQQASAREVEVIVADNGSMDGAPEVADKRAGVRVLNTGQNLGYGKAANLGVLSSSADWVVVANPDVVWTPGSLDELLAVAQRWPRAGSIGPLIRTPDGDVYPSARQLPSLTRGIGHAAFGWFWPTNRWTAAYRQDHTDLRERPAGWLSGSCILLRRIAFDSVDGFDPSYFMYFEDVDLGDRLGRAGWLNVYAPSAEVSHVGAHSTARHAEAMLTEHHRSAYQYLSRRYSGVGRLPIRLALRIGLALRAKLAPRLAEVAERRRARLQADRGDRHVR